MPIIEVNGHRIFEQDEVGSDLSGYDFAVDKTGETEAEKIAAERIVLTGTELDGVNGFQEITGRKYFNARILDKQATAIASANNLILTEGRSFVLSNNSNQLQTINNNNWTGGSFIFLDVLAGQQIKNNSADYGLGNYNGILLNCGSDWTASENTTILLKYDNVKNKWCEIGGTSLITGTAFINNEVTNQRVLVTASDITAREKVINLPYSIAPSTHVFAYYRNVPLTLATDAGSVTFTERGQTVTIDFDNESDFGSENRYEPQIGDEIIIRYTKYNPIPTVENDSHVSTVVGTAAGTSANFVVTVLPDTVDTVAVVNWTLYNSALALIDSGVFAINTALTHVHNLNFADLPDETYTLEAWVDVGEEVDDDVTILATTARFQAVALTYRQTSASTYEVTQTMKNIGDAIGDFALYLSLENTVPAQVGISPLITKTIAIGATVAFVYEFTGLTSIEYDAYSKYDDTKFSYNVGGDYYTII